MPGRGAQHADEPISRLGELVSSIDYHRFRDAGLVGKVPLAGPVLALLIHDGVYQGQYLETFLKTALGELGVHTFEDLRVDDPKAAPGQNYSLVVTASDVSRRRLVRIPWDLSSYGIEPDEMSVATAVRASSAIPFFFQPVQVSGATWVDGGLLSNFPVELFDRSDTLAPRWPTFGVRLTTRPGTPPATHHVHGPLALALAALDTLLTDQDAAYVEDPCTVRRTVFVRTDGISALDFDLTSEQSAALRASGHVAGDAFLATWDLPAYLAACRGRSDG